MGCGEAKSTIDLVVVSFFREVRHGRDTLVISSRRRR
jgi:hypothetical protein